MLPVSLNPGETQTVKLELERHEHNGVFEVAVEVPETAKGVTVNQSPIPEGESTGALEISIDPKVGDEQQDLTLKVTASSEGTSVTQLLPLTVKQVFVPGFLPATPLVIVPGSKAPATVLIERNGYVGPLQVKVSGLPAGVKAPATVDIPADADQATFEVEVPPGTKVGKYSAKISANHLGRAISGEVPVEVDDRPFVVNAFQVVTLEARRIEAGRGRRHAPQPAGADHADRRKPAGGRDDGTGGSRRRSDHGHARARRRQGRR